MSDSISPIAIVDELKQSYLDYAMSVIVSRALPDVRDGFKPVHRRVMYAMHVLSNDYNKAYKKSARVVGDVIGKYRPHGDSAVYDAIVRMAQDFSLRYPMVDGQGNFGSIDDDPPAAMRYTEVRMTKLTHQMLADLDKDTVDWEDNYDGSERMPSVLPARIPNLLVNGATGIAVGMATNMAPHNLTEVINACLAYAENPQISAEELMSHISGPDFPTGGIIYGRAGILDAYRTGKGRLHVRGRYIIEPMSDTGVNRDRERIVFTEVPYQTNKAKLIERIAELVRDKKIEGITEIRDESDKDGMRIAIDLRRGEKVEVIVRDRNNPGLIIAQRTLNRFSDYQVDTYTNSIYLTSPLSSIDENLNPVYLRITVESDQGGQEYTVAGVNGHYKLNDKVTVGGSYIQNDDPMDQEKIASANTVIHWNDKTKLIAEYAYSDHDALNLDQLTDVNASNSTDTSGDGTAARVKLEYKNDKVDLRAYHQQADEGFRNAASSISSGRKESAVKLNARLDQFGILRVEAVRTEDSVNEGVRHGVSASIEKAINRIVSLELGARYYNESTTAARAST